MPVSAETLSKLMAVGLVGDALLDIVRSIDADNVRVTSVTPEKQLSPSGIRMQRLRQRRRDAEVTQSDASQVTPPSPPPAPAPSPDKEIPPTPPKENNLFPEPPPQPRFPSAREFDDFWERFPNKVGKAAAFSAFDRAVKRVDIVALMAGLERYVSKTDDRPWCNPATWLNQDRWADQPAQVARGSPPRRDGRVSTDEVFSKLTEFYDAKASGEGPNSEGSLGVVQDVPKLAHHKS